MDCKYPGCPNAAEFECECRGEGVTETRQLCAVHKDRAEGICVIFEWEIIVRPLAPPALN